MRKRENNVKKSLKSDALFVLNFLGKHPKGISKATIAKKTKSKGLDVQPVLSELHQQKYILDDFVH